MSRETAAGKILVAGNYLLEATEVDLSAADPQRKMILDILQRLAYLYIKLKK